MNSRFLGVLADAAKVAVAAWAAISGEPWVEKILPEAGEPLRYLIAAIIAAVVLELLLQLVFGWPRIVIEWADKGESVPISEVVARVRSVNSESQPFTLKVSVPRGGLIGSLLLRWWTRRARLQIRIDGALVVPTCEYPSKRASVPTVAADDESNGFVVDLGPVPRRSGLWHHATVRWRDESTPEGDFNIDYVFDHDKRFVGFLLNHLIWRTKNAKQFRVVGA